MGKEIKIQIIHTRNFFEQNGASANRWRTMVEGLANDKCEIQIIFTQGYGTLREYIQYGRKGKIGNIAYSYTIFLLHNSLWMKRISCYLLSPILLKYNALVIRKKIKKNEPHIIWLQPSIEVFDIYLANTHKQKLPVHKLMIELNEFNDIGHIHSTNRLQLKISNRYSKVLIHEIIPKTDLLLIMTKHLLDYYRQFTDKSKTRILHLPMTVDLKRFDLKRKLIQRYIAYCGSSSFIKDGVDILIASFSLITERFPDVKLKIAAFMEADGNSMLSMINHFKLHDKVEYVGELERDEIPEFITHAELLLLPRPDSKQAQGGFPTKLGEYLASANPVCVTSVGEIPDYLTDNVSAFIAKPGNIDSFANAMVRALSNPLLARQIGKNGRKIAEKEFSMNIQSERLFSFLKENI